jgi:two-component system response regulator MprA
MRRLHSILLVEDDQELHGAMTAILEAEGYRVIGAFDGEEAITRLREGARPSVVVLDVMLPRKDGLQFRAEQLADPALAAIPVIAYSGDAHVAEAARTLRVRHWFRKPIDFGAMLETIAVYCPEC